MADVVQAQYDALDEIVSNFDNQSQAMEQMLSSIKSSMDQLKPNWIGRGSEAFFQEMESEMIPAAQRLIEGLAEGSACTRDLSQQMKQAEEEAASPFKSWTVA